MKFSLMTVLLGGAAAIALTLTPFVARADVPDLMGRPLQQAIEQLNLTPDQETQLAQIRRNTRTQLENLLTEEQQQQFKTTLEQGGTFRQAIAAMNPSPEQRTEMRSIFQSARQEMRAVLTTEQQQQVREFMRARRQSDRR